MSDFNDIVTMIIRTRRCEICGKETKLDEWYYNPEIDKGGHKFCLATEVCKTREAVQKYCTSAGEFGYDPT